MTKTAIVELNVWKQTSLIGTVLLDECTLVVCVTNQSTLLCVSSSFVKLHMKGKRYL